MVLKRYILWIKNMDSYSIEGLGQFKKKKKEAKKQQQ